MPDNDIDLDNAYDGPSKSQVKRDMDALQAIGEALVALSRDQIRRMDLPENLREAVLEAQRITSFGAIKRQKQFIGKLMRSVDAAPIRAQLDALRGDSDAHNAWAHRLERWRDKLIANDDSLADLLDEYPQADIQALRQAIRNARKEQEQAKPPKAFRQIYQMLKDIIPAPGKTAAPAEEEESAEE